MGKPIAGQDKSPFTLGGILVDAVNINGTIEYGVNISKQRSYNMYDIIDNQGIVHQFIKITTVDKNYNTIDPSLSKEYIASIIPDNSFFIIGSDESGNKGLVSVIQLNKAKLSTGEIVYHPEENLTYGSATSAFPVSFVDFTNSPQPANGSANLLVYVQFRNSDNKSIKTTLDVTFTCDNENVILQNQKNNIGGSTGVYCITVVSSVVGDYEIKISADGHEFDKSVTVSYLDDSEDHEYGPPVIEDDIIQLLDNQ